MSESVIFSAAPLNGSPRRPIVSKFRDKSHRESIDVDDGRQREST